jgi:hypothetical protein
MLFDMRRHKQKQAAMHSDAPPGDVRLFVQSLACLWNKRRLMGPPTEKRCVPRKRTTYGHASATFLRFIHCAVQHSSDALQAAPSYYGISQAVIKTKLKYVKAPLEGIFVEDAL